MQSNGTQRILAVCGIIAPILYVMLIIVEGLLRPGYSQVSQAMSELGQNGTPNATLQDANFVIDGILLIALAVGLHKGINQGAGSRIGPALMAVFGSANILVGTLFPLPSPFHMPVGVIGFVAMIIAIFAFSRRARRDNQWHGYGSYSLATGVLSVAIFVFIILTGQGILAAWFGLLQRIFAAPLLLWIGVMSMRLQVSN
jgi:hypothetical membrane protein